MVRHLDEVGALRFEVDVARAPFHRLTAELRWGFDEAEQWLTEQLSTAPFGPRDLRS